MLRKRSSAELFILVVFAACICASGCDRKATSESNAASNQASEQPSVAKSNTDPVASLRQLASEIPAGKGFQWTDEDTAEWNAKHRSQFRGSDSPTLSFSAESVDVQKTNSLLTPYVGYLILRVSGDDRWPVFRVTLAWQENRWVGTKIEGKWGTGWDEMGSSHPVNRLVMRAVPVEWNIERNNG